MLLKNHQGYWGIHNDILYWADTLEELKLHPNSHYLTPTQATKMWSGGYFVAMHSNPEPEILFISIDKKVQLDEEYEMLQILLKSVALGLAPKVVEMVTEAISDAVSEFVAVADKFLGSEPAEPEKLRLKSNHRKSDTTKLTQYMYDFIIYAHDDWRNFNRQNPKNKKTMEELIEAINSYMGTNKSRTSLGRVWNGHINRDDLPVGAGYFYYPLKTNALS